MKDRISEDEVVEMVLKDHKNRETEYSKIDSEVHYNYYGDRGVIDLVLSNESIIKMVEVKGTVSSANEVIRQCKRHQEYFIKGSDYGRSSKSHRWDKGRRKRKWELALHADQHNWNKVMDNLEYFRTLKDNGWKIWWYGDYLYEASCVQIPIFSWDLESKEGRGKLCTRFPAMANLELERVYRDES